MREIPIDQEVGAEVGAAKLLGRDEAESGVEAGGFFACVPDQPIGVPLRRVFKKCGEDAFEDLVSDEKSPFFMLYRRFELWLIPHGVSIIRREGSAEVTCVGLEVEYTAEGRTCSVRGVLPSFQYIVHGSIGGSILANGEIRPSTGEQPLSDLVHEQFGLEFGLKAKGSLELNFRATVATPKISAVGIFASRCEWRFDIDAVPLFGHDNQTWAIVALPKRQLELEYRTRFYFERRVAFFTRRKQSEWATINCRLDK